MMLASCPYLPPQGEFLRPLLAILDCHAQSLGAGGYQALAAPGSSVYLILAGALTIFVALFGYRMLLGDVPNARDGIMTMVKIGIVFALATSWPTFRTLVYDVALRGPAEMASAIGGPNALPGAEGGLTGRLQGVDTILAELQVIGTGKPPNTDEIFGPTAVLTDQQRQQELARMQDAGQRPRWNPEQDQKTLAQARTVYLAGTIGAFASVRLLAGLLLALGPLFALFLLFDGTRGLFEGWVRGLAGTALGALATALILGVQLALLEPWLSSILSARRAFIPTPAVPVQLLVLNLGFALCLLAALVATARVAYGFKLPPAWRLAGSSWIGASGHSLGSNARPVRESVTVGTRSQVESRAAAIAEAVALSHRREIRSPPPPPLHLTPTTNRTGFSGQAPGTAQFSTGRSSARRTRGRVASGSVRRDERA